MQKRLVGIILANSLTLVRLVLAFCFFYPTLSDEFKLVFVCVAGLTEFLDGQVARRLNAETTFGRLFDPVADKVFILAVLLNLFMTQRLSAVQIVLISTRDLLIIYALAYGFLNGYWLRIKSLHPRWSGKIATFFQFVFLFNAYLKWINFELTVYAAIVSSVIAALDYYVIYKKKLV